MGDRITIGDRVAIVGQILERLVVDVDPATGRTVVAFFHRGSGKVREEVAHDSALVLLRRSRLRA